MNVYRVITNRCKCNYGFK